MKIQIYILTFIIGIVSCSNQQTHVITNSIADSIVKIEMNLSALGVESDDFPSINATIDFSKDSSMCIKSYYSPAHENSTYSLSRIEMNSILKLLNISELEKLKNEYTVDATDQPTSTTKIYTSKKIFTISDYGLKGDYPLRDLYKIVYRY